MILVCWSISRNLSCTGCCRDSSRGSSWAVLHISGRRPRIKRHIKGFWEQLRNSPAAIERILPKHVLLTYRCYSPISFCSFTVTHGSLYGISGKISVRCQFSLRLFWGQSYHGLHLIIIRSSHWWRKTSCEHILSFTWVAVWWQWILYNLPAEWYLMQIPWVLISKSSVSITE